MTTPTTSLDLLLTSPMAGLPTGDDVWLRIEQILDSDLVTHGEMAKLVDELYQVDPCLSEVEAEAARDTFNTLPAGASVDELLKLAAKRFDLAECDRRKNGDYVARVKIIRSHLLPEEENRYTLVPSVGKVTGISSTKERITLTPTVKEKNYLVLDYPVLHQGDEEWPGTVEWMGSVWTEQRGAIDAPLVSKNGRVLSWSPPCTGTLLVRVDTAYDIATIAVPGLPGAVAGSAESVQDCTLRAFYRFQVYEAEIAAASSDPTADQDSLAKICGWSDVSTGGSFGDGDSGSSGDGGDDEPPPAEDDGSPPVGCLEPSSQLADPAYYREVCCHPPRFGLPDCATYAAPRGQVELLPAEKERHEIGHRGRVSYIAVGPGPDGCGRRITHQQVNRRSCCAEIQPQQPHPDNPTSMMPGSTVRLNVLDGMPGVLRKWEASGGLYFPNGSTRMLAGTSMDVTAPSSWCAFGLVRVDDGCTVLSMRLDNQSPPGTLSIEYAFDAVASGRALLEVSGGIWPYHLVTTGAHTVFANGQQEITVNGEGMVEVTVAEEQLCDGDFQVTVSDACAETDSATVPVGEVLGVVAVCFITAAASLLDWSNNDCSPVSAPDSYPKYVRFSGYADTSLEVESGVDCLPVGTYFAYGSSPIPTRVVIGPRAQYPSGIWYYPITYTGLLDYQLLFDPPCEEDPC